MVNDMGNNMKIFFQQVTFEFVVFFVVEETVNSLAYSSVGH
jgi:hypothetical protein